MSSNYEKHIYGLLIDKNIKFEREKRFSDLKGGMLRMDIWIPEYRKGCVCEVDGEQHWKPIHGEAVLKKLQENDRRKNSYFLAKNIPLYRIPYWEVYNLKTADDIFQEKFRVKDRWHNDKLDPK